MVWRDELSCFVLELARCVDEPLALFRASHRLAGGVRSAVPQLVREQMIERSSLLYLTRSANSNSCGPSNKIWFDTNAPWSQPHRRAFDAKPGCVAFARIGISKII